MKQMAFDSSLSASPWRVCAIVDSPVISVPKQLTFPLLSLTPNDDLRSINAGEAQSQQ